MTFVRRPYQEIVRDILTNLTQGVSGEAHRVAYDPLARPVVVPDIVLSRRPVRRVSLVSGFVQNGAVDGEPVAHTFSLNDYEVLSSPRDPDDRSIIRFLPFGTKPAPDTDVVVNYYPRHTEGTLITDVAVGSVARTVVEAIAKELAVLYEQLNLAYDSGFVETAPGPSLERVVALLGLRRMRAGRPVGTVTFRRRPGALGNVTIPAGTPVTDTADKIRYETVDAHDMLAGESTAEVGVRGATEATPVVEANVLTVIQRAIAGLESVANERPTSRATQDETDVELRARARVALLASNKGTVDAIRFGLLQLPQVRDVKVEEMPNGVPGEIRLSVSLADGQTAANGLPAVVEERIEELRPAGIRVLRASAESVALQARVELLLAGSHRPPAEIEEIHRRVRETLVTLIQRRGVGERVRNRPLVAAILGDERIVDASIALGAKPGSPGEAGADFEPAPETSVRLAAEDIAFGPDAFEQAPPAGGRPVTVEVRAVVAAPALPGVAIDAVRTEVANRLTEFFGRLSAGTEVDSAALLAALRNDARYAIDPLRLRVTLTAEDQFVQIVQGGPPYRVLPNHVFSVVAPEVTA